MKTVARALRVSRSNLTLRVAPSPTATAAQASSAGDAELPAPAPEAPPGSASPSTTALADAELLLRIQRLVGERPSYGYRRVTAMLNREAPATFPRVNHKRAYRVMRANRLLLSRHTGRPVRIHDGVIITLKSDMRWCSDTFEIACWNGERVRVGFSLDCCDREAMSFVATRGFVTGEMIRDLMVQTVERRFGSSARRLPFPIEWLSDNGSIYTADDTVTFAESIGFVVCNTPAYSPESNGMAESFVKSFKRDYVYLDDRNNAAEVLEKLPTWFADYNQVRPHKGLKMMSPLEYRTKQAA